MNSKDYQKIHDEDVSYLYTFFQVYLTTLDNPTDIQDTILVRNWLCDKNPSFDELLDNSFVQKLCSRMITKMLEIDGNMSAVIRLEDYKRIFQDYVNN